MKIFWEIHTYYWCYDNSRKCNYVVYAGIKGNFSIGNFFISPSFAPGYYDSGKGKDLGSYLEFKSQINFGWQFWR